MKTHLTCILAITVLAVLHSCTAFAEDIKLEVLMSLVRVEGQNRKIYEFGEKEGIAKTFEDDRITIAWVLPDRLNALNFLLGNKTAHTIRMHWDAASFVDEFGVNHRIIHSGVKYAETDRPQPPSTVLARSIHTDVVIPADYVYWSPGIRAGSWDVKMLIRTLQGQILGGRYYPSYRETAEAVAGALKVYEGKMFRVLLPLTINEGMTEYVFTFRILKAGLKSANFSGQISRKEWLILDSFLWVKTHRSTRHEVISKWGKPISEDEDSVTYRSHQHPDFKSYKHVRFTFTDAGVVDQIAVEK